MSRKIILKVKKRYSRIDHYLKESLPDISRTKIEKLIKNHHVHLNSKPVEKKNIEVRANDRIEIEYPDDASVQPLFLRQGYQPSIALKKLFEDEYLLVIDKPVGIPVHPGAGHQPETILDIFQFYYPQIQKMAKTERPGIVHRLDKDTSGILILAKDEITSGRMQKKFKRREVRKNYLALISGKMRYQNGVINAPISRDRKMRKKFTVPYHDPLHLAREAITEFSVLLEFKDSSFIRLTPFTGRTHQIRVHLSHYGNPVLGDRIYSKNQNFKRLALHAASVEFIHPSTNNQITINCPIPLIFRQYIQAELKEKNLGSSLLS